MEQKQTVSKEQAMQKLKHFCGYQERCHLEVKEKLYGYGLHKGDVEELMCQLIEENYLNEERFAIQFAGGKFRIKHWGKVKIKNELKLRQVSDYCIRKALLQIDGDTYTQTLNKLANDKWRTLKTEKHILIKKKKLQFYLLQKGYEPSIITDLIHHLK